MRFPLNPIHGVGSRSGVTDLKAGRKRKYTCTAATQWCYNEKLKNTHTGCEMSLFTVDVAMQLVLYIAKWKEAWRKTCVLACVFVWVWLCVNVVLSLSAWVPSVHSGFPPLTEHTEPGTFWDSVVVCLQYCSSTNLATQSNTEKNDLLETQEKHTGKVWTYFYTCVFHSIICQE